LRALARLAEPAMRGSTLAETLALLRVDESVRLLDLVVRGAVAKDDACMAVYSGMLEVEPLVVKLGSGRLADLRERASELGLVGAMHWLTSTERADEAGPAGPRPERLVHQDLKRLTLGERRSLARRASGEALKKLLQDPDPEVVHNLLANPRCTESIALAVASHRPTLSPALEAVLGVTRFAQRYRIRLALAKNPHLCEPVAGRLLVCLDAKDLEEIRNDGALAGTRRLMAQRLLELEK
jgi:hypothetical protein